MLRSFVGNNSTIKGSSLHRKDPQEVHPYCIPIHCPKNCVRCILESSPFLARPYRCRSPEEIAEFNIAEVCESVCWENSKSLCKPNIKKLEWKGAKTMFGSFSAIFWIPLVSQTPRQMTLCYPRDEKKNGRRLRLVWAWEIFRTPSWRCRRAEIFLVGICWNWNCPSPTMAYSKALFLEFIFYYELALEVFICYYELAFEIMYLYTLRTWYLQAMFSSKQYLSCPWTPLDSLSTLGRWMCYHWSRGGLWKLITLEWDGAFPFLGLPHEELALLSVWKPQDGLTMANRGVWGVISWNGLRPAGMQLNGTNAQKEWQAPASGPLGGGLGAGMSFFKALRT